MTLTLDLLPATFAVCRFDPAFVLDPDLLQEPWVFTARTDDELSLVCDEQLLARFRLEPGNTESGWRALKVSGPLDFALVGILAQLTGALAEAGISIFAISTFDTDYLLVKAAVLADTVSTLEQAGCKVRTPARGR
ncbi:MAG: ACT domain-containing protein [Pseudomonadota bacterium]